MIFPILLLIVVIGIVAFLAVAGKDKNKKKLGERKSI
jgi:hypothetical protein